MSHDEDTPDTPSNPERDLGRDMERNPESDVERTVIRPLDQRWTPPAPEPEPVDEHERTQQLPPYTPPQVSPQPQPYAQPQPSYPQPQYTQPQQYTQQYGSHPQYAAPQTPAVTSRGRVPAWTWPVLAVLSLVVGLLGGVLGSALERELNGSRSSAVSTPGRVTTAPPLEEGNTSIAAVAAELMPSTVQVLAREGSGGGTGSGFVLDDAGHVVTNNHVIADAVDGGQIQVVDSTGTTHAAELVGRSPVYDLAVLRVAGADNLSPAATGAARELLVGDGVVAFGAPLGLQQTVTAGIVSALNRPVTTGSSSAETSFINAVQTDAAINPGNSGGPLVNLAGQVVGVNTAIATTGGFGEAGNIGVGFAIPIEQVLVTAEQILETGESRYPVIGASVDTSRTDTREGARITAVNPGSPAEAAGIRSDDVVIALDGVAVTDGITLIVQIRTNRPDDEVEITVRRGDEELSFDVRLGSEVG